MRKVENEPGRAGGSRARTPAAERALAEAEARRTEQARREADLAAVPEEAGRRGPEPVRFGDWEVRGIATDF